jgi:hypothetical protein
VPQAAAAEAKKVAEEAAKYDTQLDKMKEIAWKLNETHVATVETNKKKVVGWVKALTDCADWVQIRALVLELLELIHETLQLDLEVPGTLRRPMDADMRAVCQPQPGFLPRRKCRADSHPCVVDLGELGIEMAGRARGRTCRAGCRRDHHLRGIRAAGDNQGPAEGQAAKHSAVQAHQVRLRRPWSGGEPIGGRSCD